MDLKIGQINTLTYQKDGDEAKTRKVVATYVPYPNVRTIDVSDLSAEEASEMADMVTEFQAYYADFISQAFNFETWVEHTKNKTITPKWRAFKTTGIVSVE